MNKQTEALKMAIEALEKNKRTHHYCEDTWYSCPKHEEGCADDREGEECNCGADRINAEFDKAIQACKEALEQNDKVYTNTNHGFTLKDRHFYVEGDGGIWDENFDYDASIAIYGDFEDDEQKKQYAQMVCDALNAQREALAQQGAGRFFERGKKIAKWADEQNKQPAQEPVAWIKYVWKSYEEGFDDDGFYPDIELDTEDNGGDPLYTHPAPSWQGLSDDEIEDLCHKYWNSAKGYSIGDIIDMAEQALKEKNNG